MVVFAVAGLVISQALARMPAVRDAVGASTGELGLALVGAGLGSLLAMPFTGWLVDRFGSRAVVRVCIVLGSVGWGSVGFAQSPWMLGVVLLLTGAPFGIWDVAMNVQGAHVEQQRSRSLMPFFHAAFSGGTVVGAGMGTVAAWLGVGLVQLPVTGLAGLLVGLVAVRRFIPDQDGQGPSSQPAASHAPSSHSQPVGPHAEDPSAHGAEREAERPTRPTVGRLEILIGVVCLGGALAEGSANDWLALLLVDVQGAPEAIGALALMAFNVAMTIGRLLGSPAIDRFGRQRVVQAGGLMAVVGIVLVSQGSSLPLALCGGLVWGLGTSTVFPAAISAAGEIPGRGNRAITVVSTIAYGAFLFGAPTIGLLAEVVGLDRALFVVVGCILLAVGLARALHPAVLTGRAHSPSA
jgi:MFS family permease